MNDHPFHAFDRHYERTVRYLMGQFRLSRDDARDLAQETFYRVLKSNEAYREDTEWAFIRTTAHNLALNAIRDSKAGKRSAVVVPLGDAVEVRDPATRADTAIADAEEATDFRRRLAAAVGALPEGVRLCYLLRRRGYSYEEIMAALQITLDAVKSRLHDAKKRLRNAVGDPPKGVEWSVLAEEEGGDAKE